jgi:integrase
MLEELQEILALNGRACAAIGSKQVSPMASVYGGMHLGEADTRRPSQRRKRPFLLRAERYHERDEQVLWLEHHGNGDDTLLSHFPKDERTLERRGSSAACRRAGIEHCSPNDLRRTFSHWMSDQGVPNEVIAPTMGLTDTRMLSRVYNRKTPEELAAACLSAPPASEQPRTGAG